MSPHDHQSLIDQLTADAAPVRPIPPLRVGLAGVAGAWAILVGGLALAGSLRSDLPAALSGPVFVAILAGLSVAGVAGALAAVSASVPGREAVARRARVIGLAALGAVALVGVVAWATEGTPAQPIPIGKDLGCFLHAVAFSLPPVAGLLAYVLRGWVAEPMQAAGAALAGTAAFGACAVHLACGLDGARHVLFGHVSAPAVLTLVLIVPFALLLRRFAR